MDILLQHYLNTHYDKASVEEQHIFEELLDEADLNILAWIMQQTPPHEKYADIITTIRKTAEHTKLFI